MSLILDGTNGVSDIDGSAATPAIRGTDTNTGIFFPAVDTIAFSEGGAEAMRIDSSGQVGIGTTSPTAKLDAVGSTTFGSGIVNTLRLRNTGTDFGDGTGILFTAGDSTGGASIASTGVALNSADLRFYAGGNTERMRVEVDGTIYVGTTAQVGPAQVVVKATGNQSSFACWNAAGTSGFFNQISFTNNANNAIVGTIQRVNDNTIQYNTSSDYRLKKDIAPMTGALAKVSALKPVTYKWKSDGTNGQGFIAHELQEFVPECVSGEKDAVETYTDAEGNEKTRIKPQSIDTSFLVATLTAAIQELKATVDAQAAQIAALEAAR
jgi:hypothetical protein